MQITSKERCFAAQVRKSQHIITSCRSSSAHHLNSSWILQRRLWNRPQRWKSEEISRPLDLEEFPKSLMRFVSGHSATIDWFAFDIHEIDSVCEPPTVEHEIYLDETRFTWNIMNPLIAYCWGRPPCRFFSPSASQHSSQAWSGLKNIGDADC